MAGGQYEAGQAAAAGIEELREGGRHGEQLRGAGAARKGDGAAGMLGTSG